jgi:hypothetical protein
MDQILTGIGGIFIGPLIYKFTKKGLGLMLSWLRISFKLFLRDPDVRKIIHQKIFDIQVIMKSAPGKEKMDVLVNYLTSLIPGKWDDTIIRNAAQAAYDSFIAIK